MDEAGFVSEQNESQISNGRNLLAAVKKGSRCIASAGG